MNILKRRRSRNNLFHVTILPLEYDIHVRMAMTLVEFLRATVYMIYASLLHTSLPWDRGPGNIVR